jgi:hypothetical protein
MKKRTTARTSSRRRWCLSHPPTDRRAPTERPLAPGTEEYAKIEEQLHGVMQPPATDSHIVAVLLEIRNAIREISETLVDLAERPERPR